MLTSITTLSLMGTPGMPMVFDVVAPPTPGSGYRGPRVEFVKETRFTASKETRFQAEKDTRFGAVN